MRWSWDDFRAGVRGVSLALPGAASVALIAGVAAVGAGFSALQAYAFVGLTFAGASQLAALELLAGGSALAVVVATALVINARFAVFSASLAPHFRDAPLRWRALAGALLSTPATMVSLARFTAGDSLNRRSYYFGAAVAMWVTWQVAALTGILVGAELPAGLDLAFVVPLVFVGLLVPTIDDRGTAVAALLGGIGAVAGLGLPLDLSFLAGTVVGVAGGRLSEYVTTRRAG